MAGIDGESWKAVSALLDELLDADEGQRASRLAQVESRDPGLAEQVSALLARQAAVETEGFLEGTAFDPLKIGTLAGRSIGGYTLERPLGQGGMGSVWLARRSDGRYEGHAAIKLLNLALLGQGGAERLRREANALAKLAHPNITHLRDAGLAAGQPYLVLEYVEGEPIDRWCDSRALNVAARVRLFLQVLAAVSHAHGQLILHRDIKPSNILVTAEGCVKLLDFGIAKLLERNGETGAPTEPTQFGGALTPEYAAPEQLLRTEVTTATDVYALGVLLYVVLAGRHPTASSTGTPVERLQALVEMEPKRLSTATLKIDPALAHLRGTSPQRLVRELRGDLDNIVAKALKKSPAERYESVEAFAEDLRRYLNHEPVNVRADSLGYRLVKFLRRYRLAVAATSFTLFALIAGIAGTTWQSVEAQRQRDEARFQERRAQASSEFMRNLVTQIGTTPMTMKQVLDRGREALEQQYGQDPAFVARMLRLLSGPYGELGDFETMTEMATRSLELAIAIDDPDLIAEGRCISAHDAARDRDFDGARLHVTEAERQIERLRNPRVGLLVECAVAKSELAGIEERYRDAIAAAKEAVALVEQEGDTHSTRYTWVLNNLAYMHRVAGNWLESLHVERRVAEITRQIGRDRTVTGVVNLGNQSRMEWVLGWWLAAERSSLQAMNLSRGIENSSQPTWAPMLHRGRALIALGRAAEGRVWLERMLDHPNSAPSFRHLARLSLASVLVEENDFDAARELLEETERNLLPLPTPDERIATSMVRAQLAAASGRLDEARSEIFGALTEERYPQQISARVHEPLEYAARLALRAGDHEQAIRLATDAIRACDDHFGTSEPSARTGRAELTLGLALLGSGRSKEAHVAIDRAATLIASAAGRNHPWAREARARLATLDQENRRNE